ncbi:hypothetical protein [Oceanivirga miroungae]|uniref:Uncharacterized protein n=1 Tax=Oceanivirga miroungae TaxID=1130046 RepID=A0A6I8MBK5_9FUSO|nr:hypothetical protein [Oceanivirga miroungae]VWL84797.1 hypothetical protein OMES3154_00045 [Oceanivirga miroungae]
MDRLDESYKKKYANYTFEQLRKVFKAFSDKHRIERRENDEKKEILVCDYFAEKKCDESIYEMNFIYNKLQDEASKLTDKHYKELSEKYKDKSWQVYLSQYLSLVPDKYFYDYRHMKMNRVSSSKYYEYLFNPLVRAATILYIEKRTLAENELKNLNALDLYNKFKEINRDKREYTAYSVFSAEFESRRYDNEKTKEELKDVSIEKLYEMADIVFPNKWLHETISDRLLEISKDYDAKQIYDFYSEKCRKSSFYEISSVCKKLKKAKDRKFDEAVLTYVNNFDLLKKEANTCIKKAKNGKRCNINNFPYNLISRALRDLGSYNYYQIELSSNAEYIK